MKHIGKQMHQAMMDSIKQKEDPDSLLFVKDDEIHCRYDKIQIHPKAHEIETTLFWKGEKVYQFTEPYHFGQMCTLTGVNGSIVMFWADVPPHRG